MMPPNLGIATIVIVVAPVSVQLVIAAMAIEEFLKMKGVEC
jgi:hypothetical protein